MLTMLLVVLSLMAILMQVIRAEVTAIQPTQLLAPLWLLGLPVMALVAALALLFESLPLLSGGVGNILYFFGWFFYLGQVALPGLFRAQIGWLVPQADVLGVTRPIAALQSLPRRAQFWLPWVAGVLLALAATAVLSLKALAGGDIRQWLGILSGALFVPSLALACGLGSGNGRLFQVVYLLWWFSAAVGNIWLDFMAYSAVSAASGVPSLIYLVAAIGLLGLAWLLERHTISHGAIGQS